MIIAICSVMCILRIIIVISRVAVFWIFTRCLNSCARIIIRVM